MNNNFGFIGLGLIGGSIARALRHAFPDCHIAAMSRTMKKLEKARLDGTVDVIAGLDDPVYKNCDVIFLCTPVEYNESYLLQLKDIVKPGAVITDVGSTKVSIHDTVKKLGMEKLFIGGHPMAGSEKTGYENSSSLLLENAYYILTPCDSTPVSSLDYMKHIVKSLKAIPFVINPIDHDKTVAAISHLPHLLAAGLVNLVRESDTDDEVMKKVAAGGFKDITRIASSSPVMWEQICDTNRIPIIDVLDKYITSLTEIKDALKSKKTGYIYSLFESSKEYRNSLSDEGLGLLDAQYTVSVYIADRPGSISILSAILSSRGINIKNIGINHSRESGEGALRVDFYDSDSRELAVKLLKLYNYTLGS